MIRMAGKRVRINLSDRTWVQEEIPQDWVVDGVGGTGLALEAFCKRPASTGQPGVVMAPGLLAGTNAPAGHWSTIVFYDQTEGRVAISYFGGHWGSCLKHSGFGLVEIEGQASSMTVLVVENGGVRFLDARDLVGLSPLETVRRLEDLLGHGYSVASIGVAGETGVPFASLVFDGVYQRNTAGLGAVLGRIGVKALAVKGTGKLIPASPQPFYKEAKKLRERITQETFPYRELSSYGSAWFLRELHGRSMLPVKNYHTSFFPETEMLSGESLADSFGHQPVACSGCPVGCRWTTLTKGSCSSGPEIEEIIALGPLCGISDPDALLQIKGHCDRIGVDPLAFGGLIASVMEETEGGRGKFLPFGQAKELLRMFEERNPKEFLERLKSLSRSNSSRVGFMTTDPRADFHLALHRMTWPFDEPHVLASEAFLTRLPVYGGQGKEMGVAKAVVTYQDFYIGLQCLGFCPWMSLVFSPGDLDPLLTFALGDKLPDQATSHIGRAVWKAAHLRSPILQSNTPPVERFGKLAREPIADGARAGQKLELTSHWQTYLKLRHSSLGKGE
jgi:aldehyde:ferredoxin oxidoreductase